MRKFLFNASLFLSQPGMGPAMAEVRHLTPRDQEKKNTETKRNGWIPSSNKQAIHSQPWIWDREKENEFFPLNLKQTKN